MEDRSAANFSKLIRFSAKISSPWFGRLGNDEKPLRV